MEAKFIYTSVVKTSYHRGDVVGTIYEKSHRFLFFHYVTYSSIVDVPYIQMREDSTHDVYEHNRALYEAYQNVQKIIDNKMAEYKGRLRFKIRFIHKVS